MKRIAVMTSGGDAAGMNAALRGAVRTACARGLEVIGVERGFVGLLEHSYIPMDSRSVSGIIHRGGTILRTFRCPEFHELEARAGAIAGLRQEGVEALVVIGGDGSFQGAHCIDDEGDIPTVGVPSTIDNDIPGTDYCIGYDTALNIAVDAVDKIRDTATSHGRIFVIEVMGRHSGKLALATGLCCGAEEILVPERPFEMDDICRRIEGGYDRGKQHAIIVVAEGATKATQVTYEIRGRLDREVRMVVLGHIQRGGEPSAFDRILASRLGSASIDALIDGHRDCMVGLVANRVKISPLRKSKSSHDHGGVETLMELQNTLV